MNKVQQRPDYGIDAPGVVRNLFIAGLGALALSHFLASVKVGSVTFLLGPMFRNIAIGCLLGGALMLLYSVLGTRAPGSHAGDGDLAGG